MSKISYKVVSVDGVRFLTVYDAGEVYLVSDDTHNNLDQIVDAAQKGEPVGELIDIGRNIQRRFDDVVSGRVAVRSGVVYFDDDPMHGAVADAIVRFLENDRDVTPLVKFMENIMANPQEHSRDQFYRWIEAHDFPIDDDGCIVAYKGVSPSRKSIHAGGAYVDGEWVAGHVPNQVGSVITMGRSDVAHDPGHACSTGLHAGSWDYASSFGSVILHVKINPRDVVSVPNDCASAKVRVCRYEVVGETEQKYSGSYYNTADDDDFEDDDVDDEYWDEYYPTV